MSENNRIAVCVQESGRIGEGRQREAFELPEGSRPVCILIGGKTLGTADELAEHFGKAYFPASDGFKEAIPGADGAVCSQSGTGSSFDPEADRELEDSVTEIIRRLGIPANIKGYRYIRTAVIMCLADPALLESVTGRLYPEIALRHASTPTRVERAIRHAITVAWDRAEGDEEYVGKRLHCRINFSAPRPTNSELIALISDSLMLERRIKN